ncbi:GrpB family protein [Sporosarcina sp. Te-1]|uniref:GrpB family protein n=1 Tax=Sporosarcina sp. Te-1 TaxID=2818390 RepID=UPI001A9F3E66|nr:GrpB family protein [Sporosarcina sp. Te-1]QTD43485.1 GrpB family protein [Sporosarcina sp. Te-1]
MRKVEVTPYSNAWPSKFQEEATELNKVFGSELIEIHHIGSTSVFGLSAKPIIDIMPVVKEITRIDSFNEAMRELGYEARGENGIAGRRYFQKGRNDRTHHVHVYEEGSPEIGRHLAFRDYLRAHPAIAKKYGDVKEELAKRYPSDIAAYIEGKEQLASEIEREAVEWVRKREKCK